MTSRKKRWIVFFIMCLCLGFSACGKSKGYYMEEEITAFVQEHGEEIRAQVEEAGEDERISEFDGIEDVTDRRMTDGLVSYEYAYSGILTSSLQAGFYYSIDDEPSGRGGPSWAGGYGWSEVPTEKENLWRYEEGSDNYYITKKICDHFYYYLAGN